MNAFQIPTKLLLFCFLVPVYLVFAQQPPQYTQYMYNTMVLNSGYTGTSSKIEALLLHRSQWVGIDGSPENQAFSIHGKLKEHIGLGLSATNDNLGASNAIEINGNFAYEIQTGYYTKLSLGVNAGVNLLNIDYSKGIYENDQDPLFQENLNSTRPILGLGAFFYSTNWYAGLSTQNILNSQIFDDNELITNRKSQYYFMGGYVFDLSERLKFKPTVLTKHVAGAPLTVDVSGNFLINEKLSLGLAYRYDDALSALAGFNISEKFFVGYAYDYTLTDLNNYNDGSHEIILKYSIFDRNKRALSPRFF
ncbi:type IX secretion system membrane protein PorP/SprF [Cellulophaga sp. HaHa_2_95]|uniref:PorP/SprF family type IX secretion system membrane protein n=1 Tax=unclassified Cellulophaga TaxID=2634405 RepID=UPI001C4F8070|nr:MULTISPECIES: type IX secretion system membrane protein PorP/SprF [unclassified Cellulophaga]QXP52465.1 type IX secretion system membrane protein PorP/SprF [Cellulophaga sp. HaHa_2_1]QXP55226.1 type IX secretion system membrane protein PorP/SprF [Cellulophaga sp. HaHa_2_95]